MNRILIAALMLAASRAGFAQDNPPARAAFPSGNAAWSVELRPLDSTPGASAPAEQKAQQAPLRLLGIEVTRAGELTRSLLRWSNGRTSEIWWLKNPKAMLVEKPDGSAVEIDTLMVGVSNLLPDAAMFSWINTKSYVDERAYLGKKCRYYESRVPDPRQVPSHLTNAPPVTMPYSAWLDAETGLPVALNDGQNIYVFQFLNPPSAALALPPRFQAELDRAQKSAPSPEYLGKPRSWQRKQKS